MKFTDEEIDILVSALTYKRASLINLIQMYPDSDRIRMIKEREQEVTDLLDKIEGEYNG